MIRWYDKTNMPGLPWSARLAHQGSPNWAIRVLNGADARIMKILCSKSEIWSQQIFKVSTNIKDLCNAIEMAPTFKDSKFLDILH